MKSKPNRNLDAAARNRIFAVSRMKGADASKIKDKRKKNNIPFFCKKKGDSRY